MSVVPSSRRRVSLVVLLACLLALAGCSSPVGDSTRTQTTDAPAPTTAPGTTQATPTPTATEPRPTTTRSPTRTTTPPGRNTTVDREGYPPGITPDGIRNASLLLDTHGRRVMTDGATVRGSTRLNGTVDDVSISVVGNETATVTPNATEFRWTVLGTNVRGNETDALDERIWANESVFISRVASGGSVTVNERNRSETYDSVIESAVTKTRVLRTALSNAEYTVVDRTRRNGRNLTVLRSVAGSYSGQRPVSNYTARFTVDRSGVVRTFERQWRIVTDSQTTTFRGRFVWNDNTTVRRPTWASGGSG